MLSTVAVTIANCVSAWAEKVTMLMVSAAVDVDCMGAADNARMNRFDPPLKGPIDTFQTNGGRILAWLPFAKVCG